MLMVSILIPVYFFQALGYFLAFKTEIVLPPVVFVLTETVIKVLLFPFCDTSGHDLCIALKLKDLNLWENSSGFPQLCQNTLTFLALLTLHRPNCDVKFPKCTQGEFKKSLHKKVLTHEDFLLHRAI